MNGELIGLPGPSIEAAMNVVGISDQKERLAIFNRVKMVSRSIVKEISIHKREEKGPST